MKALSSCLGFVAATTLSLTAFADGHAGSILFENEYLFPGQRIVSDGCYNHLEMQYDGNLVLYSGRGTASVRWNAGVPQQCYGGPWPFASGCISFGAGWVVMQGDGNFVQYDSTAAPFFHTNTPGGYASGTAQIWVQDDGNLVEYRGDPGGLWAAWASNTVGEGIGISPCEMRTSITHMEWNTNLAGLDYHSEPTNDSMECGAWCAESAWASPGTTCNAFTWVPPGIQGPTGMCWLKRAIAGASYASGMVSAFIRH